jgi:hypothetical protein
LVCDAKPDASNAPRSVIPGEVVQQKACSLSVVVIEVPTTGRVSSPEGRADLVRLATWLILEEALEGESRDALGREYCEHGAEPGRGYRNGSRTSRLRTAEAMIDFDAGQLRNWQMMPG